MWMMWLAFADAGIRSGINEPLMDQCREMRLPRPGWRRAVSNRPAAVVAAEDFALPGGRPDCAAARCRRFRVLSGDNLLDAMISLGREAAFGAAVASRQ